jgi:hypothetical protein
MGGTAALPPSAPTGRNGLEVQRNRGWIGRNGTPTCYTDAGKTSHLVMNREAQSRKIVFTAKEIRAFKIHALLVAGIAAGLVVAAPKGMGQLLGVLFAVALLPLPPLLIYLLRRRKPA